MLPRMQGEAHFNQCKCISGWNYIIYDYIPNISCKMIFWGKKYFPARVSVRRGMDLGNRLF